MDDNNSKPGVTASVPASSPVRAHKEDDAGKSDVTWRWSSGEAAMGSMPLFGVWWAEPERVVVGGGGGTRGTGIPSGLVLHDLHTSGRKVATLEPVGFLNSHDELVGAVSGDPSRPGRVAAGMGPLVLLIRLAIGTDERKQLICTSRFRGDWAAEDPYVAALAWSPDGKWLATGGDDCTVRLHQIDDDDNVKHSDIGVLQGHDRPVVSLDFNRTGELVASAAAESHCCVWRRDKTELWKLRMKQGQVNVAFRGCRFSRTHPRVLFTWMNGTPRGPSFLAMWDVQSGAVIRKQHIDATPVVQGEISGDGSLLAVATNRDDATLYIYQSDTLLLLRRFRNLHDMPVTCLNFSPAGDFLISVSADKSYEIVSCGQDRLSISKMMILLAVMVLVLALVVRFLMLSDVQS